MNKILVTALTVSLAISAFSLYKLVQNDTAQKSEKYPFLSKRIFIENQNDIIINFIPLRSALKKYDEQTSKPLGIYFEYLPSGTSIGINEKETFFGASLLKLPTAMKAYHLTEEGKLNKTQEITIQEQDLDKGFGNLWQKGAGAKITLKDAVQQSVALSDNTAHNIIRKLVQPNPVSDVFNYLDIDTNIAEGPGGGVTAKSYSSVLRALYLSSYLSFDDSNEILGFMTTSPYTNRIAAGVPSNVKVAHKLGMYKDPVNGGNEVHSDCGIVYVPKRPYILCIMTTQSNDVADKQISSISKIVYDYVSTANNK